MGRAIQQCQPAHRSGVATRLSKGARPCAARQPGKEQSAERYACRELYRRGELKDEARRIERELALREVQLRD